MPAPYFNGQTSHPLTEQEINAFWAKIDFGNTHPEFVKRIKAGLEEMMKLPTGREQIRRILADPKPQFKIKAATLQNAAGNNDGSVTRIGANELNCFAYPSDVKNFYIGCIALHEMLHEQAFEEWSNDAGNSYMLGDIETQALNSQLACEFYQQRGEGNEYFLSSCAGSVGADRAYMQSYQINRDKWFDILNGNQPKPDWAPALPNLTGLNAQERWRACEAYASQMAAMETRAQYMMDYYTPLSEPTRGAMPVRSFDGLHTSLWYGSTLDTKHSPVEALSAKYKEYLQRMYPALDIDEIERRSIVIANEFKRQGQNPALRQNIEAELDKRISTDPNNTKTFRFEIQNIKRDPTLTDEQRIEKLFKFAENANLSKEAKLYLMTDWIFLHQNTYPGKIEEREKLLERMRDATGYDFTNGRNGNSGRGGDGRGGSGGNSGQGGSGRGGSGRGGNGGNSGQGGDDDTITIMINGVHYRCPITTITEERSSGSNNRGSMDSGEQNNSSGNNQEGTHTNRSGSSLRSQLRQNSKAVQHEGIKINWDIEQTPEI